MRAYFLRNGFEVAIPLEDPNPKADKIMSKSRARFKKFNNDIKQWVADGKPKANNDKSIGQNILNILKDVDELKKVDPSFKDFMKKKEVK